MLSDVSIRRLREQLARHEPLKDRYYDRTAEVRRQIGNTLQAVRAQALDEMFDPYRDIWLDSEPLGGLRRSLLAYFERCDWSFLDMIALAASLPHPPQGIAEAAVPNTMAYHALRMLDDVLDSHLDYKGGQPTLLGELTSDEALRAAAPAANLIPAMTIALKSGAGLQPDDRLLLENTLMGMLHEAFSNNLSSRPSYLRIAERKMVCYGLFLYSPVVRLCAPDTQPGLLDFLRRSFLVAQVANDLHDRAEDRARGQPNFWLTAETAEQANRELLELFDALSRSCNEIAPTLQGYAHGRLADLLRYVLQARPEDP